MAHIALVTGLLTGRINSSFELSSRLQKEGHSITYLCQPQSKKRIKKNGFTCFPVSEITFNYQDPRRSIDASWISKLKFHFKNINNHYAHGKQILKLEEHKEVLRQVNPDLVLIDTEIHDFIFTALELKIPVKLLTTWFSDTISLQSPSIRTDVIPGIGFNGTKLGVFLSWFKMRMKIHARVLINRLTFENYRRWMFKKYAQEIGFDTNEMYVNTLPPLWSFKNLPIVSLTLKEMEFPHKYNENVIYLGPMVYENRIENSEVIIEHEKLKTIYKRCEVEERKLIYCSVGSLAAGDQQFLERVIKAVGEMDTVELILSIGPKMDMESFEKLPNNVNLFNWVPQIEAIKNSDCAVIACGINSINECLRFGVPMLLYSAHYTDQDGNAARLSYHGLGIRGNFQTDSISKIKSNLNKILHDDSIQENMNSFNKIYQDYNKRNLSALLLN